MFLDLILSGAASACYFLQLRRNQWKSPRELKKIQFEKLKGAVQYAYNFIPYYRRLFKSAKFKPEELRRLNDLRKIPTTSKYDVRNNYSNMFVNGVDESKYNVSFSSGSTGLPMKILNDTKTNDYSTATVAYCSMACGLGLRDRIVKIGGSGSQTPYIPNKIAIPYPAESGELGLTIDNLKRIKPDAIYTQPWMLSSLCTVDVSGIKPKLVFSHGATLPKHTRDLVKSSFGIEINDTYASNETNRLAFECNEHSGLHVITDNSVIEFLDDGEPVSTGETGEIVVTGFSNFLMPFIRYELGDLGVSTDEVCSCGRSWPLIKSVEGRTHNIFTLGSGRKIYPKIFVNFVGLELIENILCVSDHQVVQEERNKIVLKFVKGKDFNMNRINRIKGNLDIFFSEIGEDVVVEVLLVKEIPVESSGKKQKYISLSK